MDGDILYKVAEHVGYVTISRSNKMNSITMDMAKKLHTVAAQINEDPEVRVVVLTGEGERSFSTGSDINLIHQYGNPWELRNRQDYCAALRSIRKPIVAKIRGYALGGGFEMVLASDIRVATPTAKFAASEVKHGWISGSGLIQILSRNIGYNKAAKLILTGETVDAVRGEQLGFINDVVEEEIIDQYVEDMVKGMTELSPVALQLAKQDLVASQNMSLEMGLKYENDLFAFSFTTEDSKEGLAAFKEKRAPKF